MDSAGKRHRGRLISMLLVLNLLLLAIGVGWEYWQGRPHELPSVNAEKIRLMGAQEGHSKER